MVRNHPPGLLVCILTEMWERFSQLVAGHFGLALDSARLSAAAHRGWKFSMLPWS